MLKGSSVNVLVNRTTELKMEDDKSPKKNRYKKTIAKIHFTTAIVCLFTELLKMYETSKSLIS